MISPYGLEIIESCITCKLRDNFSFCDLPPTALQAFESIKYATAYPQKAVLFVEGQMPRGIFVLCKGRVKLSINSPSGRTVIVKLVEPGEVLGMSATISGKPYQVTTETIDPCQVNFVKRDDFLRFLKEHGDACLHAAQHISRECQDAYEVIRSIGLSRSVSARVAKFFLESATDGRVTKGAVHASLALTHEEIAQLMGTCRETITRTMAEFRKKDIVELKGSTLIIHNKPALERLVAA